MKKTLKKILFISLLFSAAIPSAVQASFFNWTTLKNGAAEIGNKAASWPSANGGKHQIAMVGTVAVTAFTWKWLRQRKLNSNLWKAIKEGNVDQVEQALKSGANANTQSYGSAEFYGQTALMYAVYYGNLEVVELLLKHKADINKQDKHGRTVLMLSINSELIELLLVNGAATDKQDECGWTALMYAAKRGLPEVVQLLLANNANPDKQNNNDHGQTALMYAAYYGNLKVVKLLLENEASVNKQDQFGRTALMSCCNLNVIELLLANEADVEIKDFKGRTALERLALKKQYRLLYIRLSSVDLIISLLEKIHRQKTTDALKEVVLGRKELKYFDTENIPPLIAEFTY